MRKRFTIGGAIVGLLCGGGVIALAFIRAPGAPGLFELFLQAALIGVFVAAGAVGGFLLGSLVTLLGRKK